MNNFGLPAADKHTILIVDDSVENLQLLTALLRDDYRIKVAKNGKKAIELVQKDPSIDLVLMDVVMPEMDGYTACKLLKEDDVTSQVPIIFLTSLNKADDETRGFEVGGADFISKPFNAQVVKARIRTHLELEEERKKADTLLRYLLPNTVIQELKMNGSYTPVIHQHTSIMFCDLIDFTTKAAILEPTELVNELTELFTEFDEIVTGLGCLRIKTIGDGYMAASGLGKSSESEHAVNLVSAGLDMIDYLKKRNETNPHKWECRIGIHSGPVISGVVGNARCQFDIMGDNVNIASRVESQSSPMKVTVTEATATLLSSNGLLLKPLGEANLKGKGVMNIIEVSRS
ncbi:MAG: response regulator [Flavobacteriales bacterium]|nr:response regulator [Flavobacteriales bacterium]